jgi:hypothetical protein
MTKHWRECHHFLATRKPKEGILPLLAWRVCVVRQSYRRVAKRAAIMVGRYG